MDDKSIDKSVILIGRLFRTIVVLLLFLVVFVSLVATGSMDQLLQPKQVTEQTEPIPSEEVIDGIHMATGLVDGSGLQLVVQNCTGCHSAKLISQNRMSLAGWTSTIKWMQETQNLWDLGENEEAILAYLAENYAPKKKGRRATLQNIEWYELD